MSIIYEPQLIFNVRNALTGALQQALGFAALDFISGMNKPWAYYLGLAFGGAGLATGIPGAAATIYIIGDSMDFWIFKSPDGSELRWFLNGVQQTTIDTYAATGVWELVQNTLLNPSQVNEATFVNFAASSNPSATGIPWLALGDFEIFGDGAVAQAAGSLNMDTIRFRIADDEASPRMSTLAVAIPSGQSIATLQAYSDIAAVRIDRVTGGEIMEISVELNLVLPTKAGSPGATEIKNTRVTNVTNERGGLISFDTSGPRNESVWVPAINPAIMPGDSFSLEDTAVASLIALLTSGVTANAISIRPVTPNDYQYNVAIRGVKSLRRKS